MFISFAIRAVSSAQTDSLSPILFSSLLSAERHASFKGTTAVRAFFSCTISRGDTFPVATFDTMRSISPTMASCESAVSFISGCLKKHSTTDCLFSISFASVSGNTIHLFKRRAPIGVTVVSRTSSSDNPPSCMVFNNSRERIVNLSNLTYLSSSILERDVICDSCVC